MGTSLHVHTSDIDSHILQCLCTLHVENRRLPDTHSHAQVPCVGFGEHPRPEEVNQVMWCILNHLYSYPPGIILVHCTHGYNRTGVWGAGHGEWMFEAWHTIMLHATRIVDSDVTCTLLIWVHGKWEAIKCRQTATDAHHHHTLQHHYRLHDCVCTGEAGGRSRGHGHRCVPGHESAWHLQARLHKRAF